MRVIDIGRNNFMFVGSKQDGKSAAIIYALIEAVKLSGINKQVWLIWVLERIADHKINRVDALEQ